MRRLQIGSCVSDLVKAGVMLRMGTSANSFTWKKMGRRGLEAGERPKVDQSVGLFDELVRGNGGFDGCFKRKEEVKSAIYKALKHGDEELSLQFFLFLFEMKERVTNDDCTSVLRWCSDHNMAKMAKEFWKLMEKCQIEPDVYSVAYFLGILSRGGYLDEALRLLQMLGSCIKGVQANVIFCNILLNGCSYTGSVTHAEQCLNFMKGKGIKEDEVTYLELIKLAGKRKDFLAIRKAWTKATKICRPSIRLYHTLVVALSRTGTLAEAFMACQEMLMLLRTQLNLATPVGKDMRLIKEANIQASFRAETVSREYDLSLDEHDKSHVSVSCRSARPLAPLTNVVSSDSQIQSMDCQVSETKRVLNSVVSPQGFNSLLSSASNFDQNQLTDAKVGDTGAKNDEVTSGQTLLHATRGWTSDVMLNINQRSQQDDVDMQNESPLQECLKSIRLLKLTHLSEKVQKEVVSSVNGLINAAVNRRDFLSAEKLFNEILAVGLKPDLYSCNAVLRAVVRARGLPHAFRFVRTLEMQGMEPDANTYSAMLEGFCRNSELAKAEALLQRMVESKKKQRPSCVCFNIVINACAAADDLVRALRIFARMKLAGVKPDTCTILALISAFGRVNNPFQEATLESREELSRRLFAIEAYMASWKLQHTCHSFAAVLGALGAEGMVDAVIQRLHQAENCMDEDGFPILDVISYNVALQACVQSNKFDTATIIFRKMKLLNLKPDCHTYNIMVNGCCKAERVGDAFQLTDMMRKEGLKPNLWTYNTLMKVICHAEELDAAIALLKEMQMKGVQPDRITFNTLVSSAVYQNRLDVTEFLVEHMNKSRIQPDLITCEHVVSIYENCGQWDDAAEALRVLSIRMLSLDGRYQKQMQEALQEVFTEDGSRLEENTQDMYDDAVYANGLLLKSLLTARLSGFGSAATDSWDIQSSTWAKRIRAEYERSNLFK